MTPREIINHRAKLRQKLIAESHLKFGRTQPPPGQFPTEPWSVPTGEWAGQPCFILGGGPSLRGFDASVLRGKGRVIAVNDAGLYMAPWADMLYFSDTQWLGWNATKLHMYEGPLVVTRHMQNSRGHPHRPKFSSREGIKSLKLAHNRTFSTEPDAVGGWCSGGTSINVAALYGASPIVLLGFDMHDQPLARWREGNWHSHHLIPTAPGRRAQRFIPHIEQMVPGLAAMGTEVLNATPDSALKCFPAVTLEEVLRRY